MDQTVKERGDKVAQAGRFSGALGAARQWLRDLSLSSKLLLLTVSFVMLAEVLIFVPSVANFQITWLMDRLTAAQLASLAAEASPTGDVPQALRRELLTAARIKAVALKRNDQRLLILQEDMPSVIDQTIDLTEIGQSSKFAIGPRLTAIVDAVSVLFSRGDRTIRVLGRPGDGAGDLIEVVLPERPLRSAMFRFGLNILGLSVLISVITAALVYMALNRLLVAPMRRIAGNMLRFSQMPEDRSRIIVPTQRGDEIGTAERELAHMQSELTQMLAQKNRLAALGLAVSKINHDLRNLLANTQLLSDRLTSSPDPTVQRFAPKLIASLDRAIAFCNDTLRFGRAEETEPRREVAPLYPMVEEVGDGLGLPREGSVGWRVEVDPALEIDADPDQLFRILTNLVRNAAQAIETVEPKKAGVVTVKARRDEDCTIIEVSDDGPGVPAKAKEYLFKAFQGSVRRGGTGLGLAIAHELVVAHGGTLSLVDGNPGAVFVIRIPDRPKP